MKPTPTGTFIEGALPAELTLRGRASPLTAQLNPDPLGSISRNRLAAKENIMVVTAWKNGRHRKIGTSYGLKVKSPDRDKYFRRQWKSVTLNLERRAEPIEVSIDKDSFWSAECHELIHAEVRAWLWANGMAPWPKGDPPELFLEPVSKNHFRLQRSK